MLAKGIKKTLLRGLVLGIIFILLNFLNFRESLLVFAYVGGYEEIGDDTQGGEFKVSLKVPKQAKVGEEVSVIAIMGGTGGFLSDSDFPHRFNWILGGKTVQPLVAGSQDKLNEDLKLENSYGILEGADWASFKIDDGKIESGGAPQGVYRTVKDKNGDGKVHENVEGAEDRDKDYIADEWEIKYFAGRTIGGKTYSKADIIGPNGYPKVLDEVLSTDDPDRDGFDWHWETINDNNVPKGEDYDDDPDNAKKEGISSSLGVTSTGDGDFINFEEYVWGLDPTSADTDQDGILDGADIAGLGNNNLTLTLDPSFAYPGRKIPVEVVANGMICLGEQNCPGNFEDGRWGLVWGKGNIVVTTGAPLKINLQADPEVPTPDNGITEGYLPVKVTAQVVGAEKEAKLYYKWYIGTAFMEDYSGYGKNELEFPITAGVCEKIPITLDVSEEGTGRMGSAELELEVGTNIAEQQLMGSLLYNTVQDQDGDGNIDINPDTGNPLAIDPFYDLINNDLQSHERNVRVGDVIKIHASPDFCETGTYPDSDGPEDFIYQWYLDGKEQTDQSGAGDRPNPQIEGGTFQDFKFTVTKPPGDEHLIKLKLIRITDGFEYGQLGEKIFEIQGPEIDLIPPADLEPVDEDMDGGIDYYQLTLGEGEEKELEVGANLSYFQPTWAESYKYTWTWNQKEPITEVFVICPGEWEDDSCITTEPFSAFRFTAKGEADITLTLDVGSDQTGNEDFGDETATETMRIVVKKEVGGGEAQGPVTRLFAQTSQAVSDYFKNIFNIVLSIGVIGFIVFVVMAAGEVRKRK